MRALRKDLPRAAPVARLSVTEQLEHRVTNRRAAARRLGEADARAAELMAHVLDQVEQAKRAIADLYAQAQAEAACIIARSPDFDALARIEARNNCRAINIVQKVATRHNIAMAAVMKPQRKNPRALAARLDAARAIHAQCPQIDDDQIGALFGVSGSTVRRWWRA